MKLMLLALALQVQADTITNTVIVPRQQPDPITLEIRHEVEVQADSFAAVVAQAQRMLDEAVLRECDCGGDSLMPWWAWSGFLALGTWFVYEYKQKGPDETTVNVDEGDTHVEGPDITVEVPKHEHPPHRKRDR